MSLAIFDIDNTILAGDSDYLWGQYLVDRGIVDREAYELANARFYEEYKNGSLNIVEFLEFALSPLAVHDPVDLYRWREEFVEAKIIPIMLEPARCLIDRHRAAGDTLVMLTATNRFVTEPVARLYGVEHLIATSPEFLNGRFTGRFEGLPCFREGKVTKLEEWVDATGASLDGCWFYSDSHNDLPLLSRVTYPVAVDPDEQLRDRADELGWPVISLRGDDCCEKILARIDNRGISTF